MLRDNRLDGLIEGYQSEVVSFMDGVAVRLQVQLRSGEAADRRASTSGGKR